MAEEEHPWRHMMIYFSCIFVSLFVFLEFAFTMLFFTSIAPTDFMYYLTPAGFFLGESLGSFFLTFILFVAFIIVLRTQVYIKTDEGLKFNSSRSLTLTPFFLIAIGSLGVYISTIPLDLSNILIYVIFLLLFESFIEHLIVSDYKGMGEVIEREPEEKVKKYTFCPVCATKQDRSRENCTNCGSPLGKVETISDVKPDEEECPSCGKSIPTHAKECPSCGEVLEDETKNKMKIKFDELKERWNTLKDTDLDLDELKNIIQKAKNAKKRNEYEQALQHLHSGIRIADELIEKREEQKRRMDERFEELKEKWNTLKDTDLDLFELKNLIRKAKNAKKRNEHQQALEHLDLGIRTADELIEKREEQKRRMDERFDEIKEKWNTLKETDLDLTELDNHMQDAKDAKERNAYQDAIDSLNKGLDLAEDLITKKEETPDWSDTFHDLKEGTMYLWGVEEDQYHILKNVDLPSGITLVSETHPQELIENYDLTIEDSLWISLEDDPVAIPPDDLEDIELEIKIFISQDLDLIFVDALEPIFSNNVASKVIQYLNSIREHLEGSKTTMIFSYRPSSTDKDNIDELKENLEFEEIQER